MEDNEKQLMAELESIITGAAKSLHQEQSNNSLEALEAMLVAWKQEPNIDGNAWFVGIDEDSPLFPSDDDLTANSKTIDTSVSGTEGSKRMAVRCIATPDNAYSFIGMLDDPRFVLVSHHVLRPDGLYGMFTSENGILVALSFDTGGMCIVVERPDGGRHASSHGFGQDNEPVWDSMGMDAQCLEWLASAMKAYMSPRMLLDKSPHMYKAFITACAEGEQELLDMFSVTPEQLMDGLNDL